MPGFRPNKVYSFYDPRQDWLTSATESFQENKIVNLYHDTTNVLTCARARLSLKKCVVSEPLEKRSLFLVSLRDAGPGAGAGHESVHLTDSRVVRHVQLHVVVETLPT